MAVIFALWFGELGSGFARWCASAGRGASGRCLRAADDGAWPDVRDVLRPERATVGTIRLQKGAPDELRVKISEPVGMERALQLVRGLSQPVTRLGAR